MAYFPITVKAGLKRTNVYSIEMEEVTAKRGEYKEYGEKLK